MMDLAGQILRLQAEVSALKERLHIIESANLQLTQEMLGADAKEMLIRHNPLKAWYFALEGIYALEQRQN